MQKLLFLSHIHEERELALVFKQALEDEFSGFVDVFVSSDGVSIGAGANFLKKIEDGLVSCIAGIYLISPYSVKRNWINFELGAVWIRSAIAVRSGDKEIPALPLCHSGSSPGSLPAPLNNLNAVDANQATRLEFAFRSIQAAVGGRGNLKTDFDALAEKVRRFEHAYTLEANLVKLTQMIMVPSTIRNFVEFAEKDAGSELRVEVGIMDEVNAHNMENLVKEHLSGVVRIERNGWGAGATFRGEHGSGPIIIATVDRAAVLSCKRAILAAT
ncbi:TPA: toll/interleukin-1 receptor domain-containing protein [Stenotrophomonas maltophilia]